MIGIFLHFFFRDGNNNNLNIEPSYELESVRKKERIGQKLEFMMWGINNEACNKLSTPPMISS